MAKLTDEEITYFLDHIRTALQDMAYGEVVIDVKRGHIEHVFRKDAAVLVQYGRIVTAEGFVAPRPFPKKPGKDLPAAEGESHG